MWMRFHVSLLGGVLFASTVACEKEVTKNAPERERGAAPGKVSDTLDVRVSAQSSKAQAKQTRQRKSYPLLTVEYLMWVGRGAKQLGYSKDTPDPLLEWQDRWLVWKPNGDRLLGRETASPHMWDDQIAVGRYGRSLSFMVKRPEGIADLGSYSLIDSTTGEKISVYETASVMSQSPDTPVTSRSDRIVDMRMEPGFDWVRFRLNKVIDQSSICLEGEYELEDGSEKVFQSGSLSLRPDGVTIDWVENPKVLVIAKTEKFQPTVDLVVTPAKENHPVMLDLDSGALHPVSGYGLSRATQVKFHNTKSDAYVLLSEFSEPQRLALVLANTVAYQITAEEFARYTPQQALAHINAVKHQGGSYQIDCESKIEPSYWVSLTRQNGVALVKVLPTEEPKKALRLQLRVMQTGK